ncbi:MAG: gephyrin-like molybdotransferase Glp [Arenicellales bacterium]
MMKNSAKPAGPGCDEFDPGSLPLERAVATVLDATPTAIQSKRVKLRKSLGRVLAEDVRAPQDVPNHTNSAMDGYAFAGSALTSEGLSNFKIIATAYAGKPYRGAVKTGEAVKIMTGAIMPADTDTVVMQEYVDAEGDSMQINKTAKTGQNVRYAGEDVKQGAVVLHKGRRMSCADVGVLASLGMVKVKVFKRPRVAFFSNGDEIKKVGEPLNEGEVYDSNRHTLYAMLKRAGAKLIDLGVVGDDYDEIKKTIKRGNQKADMVITSAGASVGEADYIYDIISELGKVNLWKMAIKPGRPLAFGELSNSVFFGLPGNPVSVMVTFALCVKPALSKLSGEIEKPTLKHQAKTLTDLRKRPGRSEYQRAVAYNDEHGELVVNARKYQGSGVLSSMAEGNCFVVLDLESTGAKVGEFVNIILFSELF